jgi:hypothetical protein
VRNSFSLSKHSSVTLLALIISWDKRTINAVRSSPN